VVAEAGVMKTVKERPGVAVLEESVIGGAVGSGVMNKSVFEGVLEAKIGGVVKLAALL